MLSPELLQLLREWWRAARPRLRLFPGQNPINPVTARQLNRAVTAAKDLAGTSKRVSPDTRRHSFADPTPRERPSPAIVMTRLRGLLNLVPLSQLAH